MFCLRKKRGINFREENKKDRLDRQLAEDQRKRRF